MPPRTRTASSADEEGDDGAAADKESAFASATDEEGDDDAAADEDRVRRRQGGQQRQRQ